MKRSIRIAATICLSFLFVLWAVVGNFSDRIAGNIVAAREAVPCDDPAFCEKIRDGVVIDAHADTLLHRSPDKTTRAGHVSLDRLIAAGVDIQVFALAPFAPKMTPDAGDVCGDIDATNRIALLFAGKEPLRPATWVSDTARVMRMVERFNASTLDRDEVSDGILHLREAGDLIRLKELQDIDRSVVGAVLAVEGFYWAGATKDEIDRQLDELALAGIRMLGLTQRAGNHLAGSNEDCGQRSGLSELGRHAVKGIWTRGMILDLAHASSAVIRDVTALKQSAVAGGPVVVSHTGIGKTCPRDRNLSDEDIRNIARADGVIGIGFWTWAACWTLGDPLPDIRHKIAASFADAYSVLNDDAFRAEMGAGYDPVRHLALGSDFDGATTMPVDSSGLPWIIEGIAGVRHNGRPLFDAGSIRAIAGGNLDRVISRALGTEPGHSAPPPT